LVLFFKKEQFFPELKTGARITPDARFHVSWL